MLDMTNDLPTLLVLVFLRGAKHGLDPDDLATIDGMTHHNFSEAPRRAHWSGALSSIGHGVVITALAVVVGAASVNWQMPNRLDDFGTRVSIVFLTAFGFHNLWAALGAANNVTAPVGNMAGFASRVLSVSHPLPIVAVSALFAVSFDTVSQVALFDTTAPGRRNGQRVDIGTYVYLWHVGR